MPNYLSRIFVWIYLISWGTTSAPQSGEWESNPRLVSPSFYACSPLLPIKVSPQVLYVFIIAQEPTFVNPHTIFFYWVSLCLVPEFTHPRVLVHIYYSHNRATVRERCLYRLGLIRSTCDLSSPSCLASSLWSYYITAASRCQEVYEIFSNFF